MKFMCNFKCNYNAPSLEVLKGFHGLIAGAGFCNFITGEEGFNVFIFLITLCYGAPPTHPTSVVPYMDTYSLTH